MTSSATVSTRSTGFRRTVAVLAVAALAATAGQGLVTSPSTAATALHKRYPLPAAPTYEGDALGDVSGRNTVAVAAYKRALADRAAAEARAEQSYRADDRTPARAGLSNPMAGATSDNGDYTATPLAPSATWAAGTSTGSLAWSYPMRTPAPAAGPQPMVQLNYDSGSIDGRTPASNNQGSQVGEGFELTSSYVSRSYASCHDDAPDHDTSYDLCWRGGQVSMVLNGQSTQLVKVNATTYRLAQDDGSRMTLLKSGSTALNGDDDGEHWLLTTVDGTRYSFGLNKLPGWGSGSPTTNSTWTVPVFGNDANEPCNGATFAASSCPQAWQWNLDSVIDPHGNTETLWYAAQHNSYAENGDTSGTDYIRGGYLTRIEYGLRSDAQFGTPAQRVILTPTGRCTDTPQACGNAPTSDNKRLWPDVPFDSICGDADTCTGDLAPTFFTTKMLASLTTQIRSGSGYQNIDKWTLTQKFLHPAEDNDYKHNVLWLRSVQQRGLNGDTPVTLPAVQFTQKFLANRVDGSHDDLPPLERPRLRTITSETGQLTTIDYTSRDCAWNDTPAPADNHRRCYPVYWTPPDHDVPEVGWFHKYAVAGVQISDLNQPVSQAVVTNYDYATPSWHYADTPATKDQYTTWSEFRGYQRVTTTVGNPSGQPTKSVNVYLQGMDGDLANKQDGTRKNVSVTGIQAPAIRDADQYAGYIREHIAYKGTGSTWVNDTITDPWSASTTSETFPAQRDYPQVVVKAWLVRDGATTDNTHLTDSDTTRSRVVKAEYNDDGLPVLITDRGDSAKSGDESCTHTWYARNSADGILSLPARVQQLATTCDDIGSAELPANSENAGDVISDTTNLYDGASGWSGQTPASGDVTKTQRVTGYAAGEASGWQTVTTNGYDALGRLTSTRDADPQHPATTMTYTPVGAGVPQKTTVTNAVGQTTTTFLDAATSQASTVVDANQNRTDYTYDALGRISAMWAASTPKTPTTPPTVSFGYQLSRTAASWASTSTRQTIGDGRNTSYQFYDALSRPIQTQTPAATNNAEAEVAGRIVSATAYDDRGLPIVQLSDAYDDTSAPSGQQVSLSKGRVPLQVETVYDGAMRPTTAAFSVYGEPRWSTTTSYTGDSVATSAPNGGSARRVDTDALGRTTRTLIYAGPQPNGAYRATTSAYLPTGSLDTLKGPDGATWTYSYDLYGRVTGTTDPDTGTTTTRYTDLDQPDSTTDARNSTLLFRYDALGRRTGTWTDTRTDPNKLAAWTYDTATGGLGQAATSTSYVGGAGANGHAYTRSTSSYDALNQPLDSTISIPTDDALVTSGALPADGTLDFEAHYFDNDGSVQRYQSPAVAGLPVEATVFSYNDVGLPLTLSGFVRGTLYSPLGDIGQRIFATVDEGDKASVTNFYEDGTRRLTQSIVDDNTHSYSAAWHDYTYNDAGNILEDADSASLGGAGATAYQCFGYGGYQELTQSWTPTKSRNPDVSDCAASRRTVANLGGAAPYWNSYTYTSGGQRDTSTGHAATNSVTTYGYGAACAGSGSNYRHTLSSTTTTPPAGGSTNTYGCDKAGDLTSRPGQNAAQTLTWDEQRRLAAANEPASGAVPARSTKYIYDADGNLLIRRSTSGATVSSILYGGSTEVHLDTVSGTDTISGTRTYTLGGQQVGVRSGRIGGGDSIGYYTFPDNHGTVGVTIQRSNFNITKRYFGPFGGSRAQQPTWPDDKRFLGKPYDTGTGLHHVGAREYDYRIGAFISVDPVLDTSDPTSLNGYAYADNNPVNQSDPTGLMLPTDGGATRKVPPHFLQQRADPHYFDGLDSESRSILEYGNSIIAAKVTDTYVGPEYDSAPSLGDWFDAPAVHACSDGVSVGRAAEVAMVLPGGSRLRPS